MSESAERTQIRLDLAGDDLTPDGWVGLGAGLARHRLFTFPWSLDTDSVTEARCVHFIEHLPHREGPCIDVTPQKFVDMQAQDRWAYSVQRWGFVRDLWFDFWEEVHRVLAPDAKITVVCARRQDDPTVERTVTEASFDHLSQAWLAQRRLAVPYEADFKLVQRFDGNTVDDVRVVLKAKKPAQRWWKKEKA